MLKTKLLKKRKRKTANPKHDKHCSYWAGCNPFSGEEGHCDCGLSEAEVEPEVYVVLEEASKKPRINKQTAR